MFFKGNRLFWLLRSDVSGSLLLRSRPSLLRKVLLTGFHRFNTKRLRLPSLFFAFKPAWMQMSHVWFLYKRWFLNINSIVQYHEIVLIKSWRFLSFMFWRLLSYKQCSYFSNYFVTTLNELPYNTGISYVLTYLKKYYYSVSYNLLWSVSISNFINQAIRYNLRSSFRPKRYYLFLTEKRRKRSRILPIRPRSSLARTTLKKKVTSLLSNIGVEEFQFFSKFLLKLLKDFSTFTLIHVFAIPWNRINYLIRWNSLNSEYALNNNFILLQPGDLWSVQFFSWKITNFFYNKQYFLIVWLLFFAKLYSHRLIPWRLRRKRYYIIKRWRRLWIRRAKFLSQNSCPFILSKPYFELQLGLRSLFVLDFPKYY